ncbi:hypothetical protein M378DRAFT_14960 [Amanita muscaria Koide BX008]|uniref:NACHT domain-containing protein n=1 Tax=Amanita muscaria (strain Koide BX008) TaxID=946122 RepID=A0A0C2SYN5_AMAMK|nr:hypothetical protein M378DRAFT_14960 [Amanita muscaria Koide BX008]
MGQNISNEPTPTQNPGVHWHTDGGASFGNANFEGGAHNFGTIVKHGPDAYELKEHQLISSLPHAEAGRKVHEYNKQSGPCFPGTREAILETMKKWTTNLKESRMYVLSGLAGIGKSTVAYSIAAWADEPERHHLGAEFFFSRDEADRSSAKLFFITIAYNLYFAKSKAFKRAIGEALVAKGRSTGTPQEQLDDLILDPLKPIKDDLPLTLIVVDALDECDYKDDARLVFDGLRKLVQALPSFKVLLTTRPEALSNKDSTTQEGRKVFRLHDIEDDVVNEDIRIYLKSSLSMEQVKERLPDLERQWCASDEQVECLIQASGKLFIMASTAVRYILDRFSYAPDSQIKELLDAFAQGRTPFDNLVDFYTIILRSAIPDKCRNTRLVDRYQAIVGTIVLAQDPLSVHSIASLIEIDVDNVLVVLRQLQSVIFVADNKPRAYHKSFVDYITDSEQCDDINLRIDPTKRHTRIAGRCFEMMGKHLKINILGLGVPARFLSNEGGRAKDGITDEKLQEKIPQVLQYACAYWDGHLNRANTDDADLVNELEKFDKAHVLLPWFEVLSLIGKLDSAPRAIRVSLKVLTRKLTPSKAFRQLLSDGLRFISKFYEIIEQSAFQTYYSALLFTPTDSLLYRRYINEALHLHRGCNVIGIPNQWDAFIANLRHGGQVTNIQFSLDSTMFVSWNHAYKGSEKGIFLLKVWDAVTGTPISTIEGGGFFAIANDFSTVASFENKAITLYNVDGSIQGATFTTSAMVMEVAISSESSRMIAAGLSDNTISLWDTRDSQDGKPTGSFEDYDGRYRSCLEFSATGARLAYLSANNGVVKLWDAIKREFVADLDCGSGGFKFAFSRDGSRIASWAWESGLRLWDCAGGQRVGTIEKSRVYDVAISDNGSLLAFSCATNQQAVQLWGENGHLDIVELDLPYFENRIRLAFSRDDDDTLAITTDFDAKLYSIKNRSFLSTLSISQSPLRAISPDCTRFAVQYTGSPGGGVSLLVIESSSPSSNEQESRRITALALSWNCSRVACGFDDGAVELWDTVSFQKRQIGVHRSIMTLGFSPNGEQFASGSNDGIIVLRDVEDGARRADFQYSNSGGLWAVEVSNSVLAAAGDHGISLWNFKTLDHIEIFDGSITTALSFSADGALLAAAAFIQTRVSGSSANGDKWSMSAPIKSITVFEVKSFTAIATFKAGCGIIHMMAFLADNSLLVAWEQQNARGEPTGSNLLDGLVAPKASEFEYLALDLVSGKAIRGPSFEKSIQSPHSPHMPLWHGVPAWVNRRRGQYYLEALFSQHDGPVPVLWIPRELNAFTWVQGRSMIVLRCGDRRVVLLQLPTIAQQTATTALPYGQNMQVPTALVRKEVQKEEEGRFASVEFGGGSSHRHEMYTTAPPPLPPQSRESTAPAPPPLPPQRRERPALTPPGPPPLPPQCRESPALARAPPPPPPQRREGPALARAPPPPPPQRRESPALAQVPPPPPPQRRENPALAQAPPPPPPQCQESPAPTRAPPPRRREGPTPTPPPVPPRRRGPGSAPSALNLNEPAAITYHPHGQLTPSQCWAPSDTEVSAGHVPPHPASPPHTGQVGRGPQQSRLPTHRYREYTTTTLPQLDGPY